jgi:hypothetical protein
MNTTARERSIANFLRFLAICELLLFSITFMPESWLAAFHAWLGLGHLPDSVFLQYITRGATLCQGAIGAALWIMSTDVIRYRPLVIVTAVALLIASPGFYIIDTVSGMPLAAKIWDCTACFLAGATLLALCFSQSSSTSPQRT